MKYDEETRKKYTKGIVFMNDEEWPEYVIQDKLTILHFLSSVDLVSREQIPQIRQFAEKYGDSYTIGVLDAGLCPKACLACDVHGFPAMCILRQGVLLGGYRGHLHEEDLPEFVLQLATWQKLDMSTVTEEVISR